MNVLGSDWGDGGVGDCGGVLVPLGAARALEAWLERGAPPIVVGDWEAVLMCKEVEDGTV